MSSGNGPAVPDFASVVETLSDVLVVADAENVILYANQAVTDLLGWKPEELIGKTVAETLVPERLRSQHLHGFDLYVATSHPTIMGQTVRLPARASDGAEVDIELRLSRAKADDGSAVIVGALRDVRDRMVLERRSALVAELLDVLAHPDSLEETATRILRGICMSLDWDAGAMWMIDRPTNRLHCIQFWHSPAVEIPQFQALTRMTVFRKGAGLPGRVWELGEASWIEDVATEHTFRRSAVAVEEGLHSGFGLPISKDGKVVGVAEFFSRQVLPPQEELIDTMTSIGDQLGDFLSDRAATEELAFQNALLQSQSEASMDAILVVSPRGEMIYFNQKFIDLWGIPQQVVESRSDKLAQEAVLSKLVDPGSFLARIAYLYDHPDESSSDELHLADGRIIERNSAPVRSADGTYYGRVWFFRDVTSQRRAANNLSAIAHVLQESLLPPELPEIPGIQLAAMYRPGKEGSEVGGDFYDAFQVRGQEWALVIGDVCGKGAPAATLTSLARHTLQAAATLDAESGRVLSLVNDAFLREGSGRFCTLSYTRIRKEEGKIVAEIAAAGHPAPLVLHPGGGVEIVPAEGDLLGVMEEPETRPVTVALEAGDTLVFYTDGLADLIERRLPAGSALESILSPLADSKPSHIVAALEELAEGASREGRYDDIAVLVARIPRDKD